MEIVTLSSSSDGQIAIPKLVRETFNLSEGTRLALNVRGDEIVLSRKPEWRKLRGLGADPGLMKVFEEHRRAERKREDSGA
jgi:AbrB family looped-hinge helix DNA binding protein